MRRRLTRAWREHPVLLVAFLVSLLLALFFALRLVVFTLYWSDPAHRQQPIEPWMTPRYIAHSWDVRPEVVARALGLPSGTGRVTIEDIARERGVPVEELARRLEAAMRAAREGREP